MVIGARYNEGVVFRFGAVDIYEIGFYPRELTPAERDALETYVQHRHGLAWNPRFIGADLAWLHDVAASGFALTGDAVDQWNDLSKNGRHWVQSGAGRPLKTSDEAGREVVRFDGADDLLALTGALPTLQPFSVGVVYRVRARTDFAGILSATSAGWHRPHGLLDLPQRLGRLVRDAAAWPLGRGQPAELEPWRTAPPHRSRSGRSATARASCEMAPDRAPTRSTAASAVPPASCSAAATPVRPSATPRSTFWRPSAPRGHCPRPTSSDWSHGRMRSGASRWLTGARKTSRTARPTGSPTTRWRSRRRSMPGSPVTRSSFPAAPSAPATSC